MQRAAAATMPTTMPVVLLLSRTTSEGTGNTFTSGRGGRARKHYLRRGSVTRVAVREAVISPELGSQGSMSSSSLGHSADATSRSSADYGERIQKTVGT
ncbi:hypothetical protein EYF80_015941 [Liparis tanakae]|uniref:Uncharacterized protein n=1 Tax=Liparis tanakae TaxID=230148 RepID=A0A4Z2I976_9TELE|nr:hypothetical protein EYF80_015941 [Liparis tanakae]